MTDDLDASTQPHWLAGLADGYDPDHSPSTGCPWARFGETAHDRWAHRQGDVLVVREHATVKSVLSDRRFKQGMHARLAQKAPDLDPRFLERRRDALLGREGPDHLRLRRIASKAAFTPRQANRHRPLMREVMHELADRVPVDGPDRGLVNAPELVHEYPSRVIAEILGARRDEVTSFAAVIETIFDAQRGIPEAKARAWEAIQDLDARLYELIERKRAEPAEDLMTDLIRAETDEGRLSPDEVHVIATAVVMAGTDTTRSQMVRGLQLLAEHPDIWRQLDDDGAAEAAVEEILRFAPLAAIRRVPSEDLPIGEHPAVAPEGKLLVLDLGAANRDPAAIEDPNTFRIDRTGPSQHFSLGHGHKYCLGANLARAEMAEGLRVLRSRFETLELAEPAQWTTTGLPRGERVMLRFGLTDSDPNSDPNSEPNAEGA